jgi:cytochrome P450
MVSQHGDVSAFDLGDRTCVLVNRADLARTLFSRHEADLRKPDFLIESNRGYWGDGLTSMEMPDWRMRRPQLRPGFRHKAVMPRLDLTRECALDMISGWTQGAAISLTSEIRVLAARLAARSVLDAEVEGYGDPARRSGIIPLSEILGEDFRAPGGGYGDAQFEMVRPRAGQNMDQTVSIIDARMAGGAARNDILSDWLAKVAQAGDNLGRDAVLGEVIQMLFASHLTLPLSLIATWRALSKHRETERSISAEAVAIDWSQPYLDVALSQSLAMCAVKEALRLMPPAPILYREAVVDFDLGGFAITAGHAVWVAPRLLHLDPRYFANPLVFDPRRFGQGKLAPASIAAYMPFGSGPRTCIASRQAFLQLAIIILVVAERCVLEPLAGRGDAFRVSMRGA